MTSSALIDTHCHLDFEVFDPDRNAILERCKASNIEHIIVPSVTAATWPRTIDVCAKRNGLHMALGLHPMFIREHQPQHLSKLHNTVESNSVIAIGEIGLDFYHAEGQDETLKEKQLLFFTKQLIIAKEQRLPVIIHNRKAHDECINILTQLRVTGGVIHAFNGSIQQAQKYIDLGFLLGFGGMLTFERSRKLRNLVKQLPLSSIVLETDAPDMTVAQHKGQRNSPEYIVHVLDAVSQIKNLSKETVASTALENAQRVFKLINL